MGWLNFHGKLVREVQKADENEVCKRLPEVLSLFLSLRNDASAWPHSMASLQAYYEASKEQQCDDTLSASEPLLSLSLTVYIAAWSIGVQLPKHILGVCVMTTAIVLCAGL